MLDEISELQIQLFQYYIKVFLLCAAAITALAIHAEMRKHIELLLLGRGDLSLL